jgi:hypothetical protein
LSPALRHATGANGIFTSLAAAARATNGTQVLQRWWSGRRCTATWSEHARPDGYGRWLTRPPGTAGPAAMAATDFFLEYDTGTENLDRLLRKLAGYYHLAARTGIPTPVLFWLPSPAREAALHARLAGPPPHGTTGPAASAIPGVPVATATPDTSGPPGPAGPAWLAVGSAGKIIAYALGQLGKPYQFSWAPGGQLMIGPYVCPAQGTVAGGAASVAGVVHAGLDLARRCAALRVILYAAAQLQAISVGARQGRARSIARA